MIDKLPLVFFIDKNFIQIEFDRKIRFYFKKPVRSWCFLTRLAQSKGVGSLHEPCSASKPRQSTNKRSCYFKRHVFSGLSDKQLSSVFKRKACWCKNNYSYEPVVLTPGRVCLRRLHKHRPECNRRQPGGEITTECKKQAVDEQSRWWRWTKEK